MDVLHEVLEENGLNGSVFVNENSGFYKVDPGPKRWFKKYGDKYTEYEKATNPSLKEVDQLDQAFHDAKPVEENEEPQQTQTLTPTLTPTPQTHTTGPQARTWFKETQDEGILLLVYSLIHILPAHETQRHVPCTGQKQHKQALPPDSSKQRSPLSLLIRQQPHPLPD